MPSKVSRFQVELSGAWKDYDPEEDKVLKRAFMSGFPGCKFHYRGNDYEYDFKNNMQKNLKNGKERKIRPPFNWKAPAEPVVPKGQTKTHIVQKGQAGTVIRLKHPNGGTFPVEVPKQAKVGQSMLVPVPESAVPEDAPAAAPAPASGGGGWSTGAKVAAGVVGAGVVGAGVVGGVLIAEHGVEGAGDIIADGAADAGEAVADFAGDAGDAIGSAAETAGEHIGEFAGDAGEWIMDAADTVGDFVMDLF
jgi:hypothetical protein